MLERNDRKEYDFSFISVEMMRFILLFFLISCCVSGFCQTHVLVSITPQKFLVERIGGDRVLVEVIVPPGASSHSYEPSPRQVVSMKKGRIWFRLGESFEERLLPVLSGTKIVDQRQGIDLLGSCCYCTCGADPHIWLSPRLLKIQAKQIAQTLEEYDPSYSSFFRNNLNGLEEELDALDKEVERRLSTAPKTILVSHPAFGYLCRDYGMTQLSVEMEGREPTPRYLNELIQKARELNIQTVFLQEQHFAKGGKRVAQELNAATVFVDPYKENVIENLKEISKAFCQ